SLGEMSAGLAHEFKNAIAALYGYAQLLQTQAPDERAKAAAESMLNEVRNLSEMITAFLDFARPRPLQLEEIAISTLLHECATELNPLYEQRRVQLTQIAGPQNFTALPNIQGDERMLRQAFLNLLRNAAEAIPGEQTDRTVRVSCATEQQENGAL